MVRRFVLTALAATAAFTEVAGGQAPRADSANVYAVRAQLSPDSLMLSDVRVVQVISGGSWIDGARRGHYRVIVLRDGGDVTHHSTYLQWLERQGLTESVQVVSSIDLHSRAAVWYQILAPEIQLTRRGWLLHVEAADGPMRPSKKRITFVLGPPGVARLR